MTDVATTPSGATQASQADDDDVIRVFVADDEATVVDVLQALIATDHRLRFVGAAHDAEEAITGVLRERPDVVLLDVRMPGGGGVRAAREITRQCPATNIIALSAHEDTDTIVGMIGAGASGYVPKADGTDRILRTIHRAIDPAWSPSTDAKANLMLVPPALPGRRERGSRVARAILENAVTATFEPVMDIGTGQIVGLDARPRVAMAPARPYDGWLADAQAEGLLLDFELTALRAVLPALARLPEGSFVEFEVTPDSASSPRFRRAVAGASASRIVLGFSSLVVRTGEDERFADALARLRASGIRLSARDVGPGLESLRQLAQISPDHAWLDRTITSSIGASFPSHSVVAAVAGCANQVGARMIADSVTTQEQLDELSALGVHMAAGTFIASSLRLRDLHPDADQWERQEASRGGSSSAQGRTDTYEDEGTRPHRRPSGG